MNNIKKKKYNIRIIKKYTGIDNNNNNNNLYIYNLKENIPVIHPITLELIDPANNNKCLTKYNYKNNKINIVNNYKCNYNVDNYKEYMYIPPISLSKSDILNIYNITSIESLFSWIENNHIFQSIDRMIHCWIATNKDTIKNYKKYLLKIVLYLIKLFPIFNNNKKNIINETNIEKYIELYIEKYINNFLLDNIDNYFLSDIYYYLEEKYN